MAKISAKDPASLQNLNDIVMPEAIGWWPLAPGWYILLAAILLGLLWLSWRYWQQWQANVYRRAALSELHELVAKIEQAGLRDSSLRQLPVLLKRTALAAYPRTQVAMLSGPKWYEFINASTPQALFTAQLITDLDAIRYRTGKLDEIMPSRIAELTSAIGQWIRSHDPAAKITTEGAG